MNSVPPHERLIVALDCPSQADALNLVDRLHGQVKFFKVGLELFCSGEGIGLIEKLAQRDCKVFADFKLMDIPATVRRAVQNLAHLDIHFLTVHAYPGVMEAAVDAAQDIAILAVTVLTSMNDDDLRKAGIGGSAVETAVHRSQAALSAGCAGVICSGREAAFIRPATADDFLLVTPGIRNSGSGRDDQKRTVSVTQAFSNGADYIVVGRPIRDAHHPSEVTAQYQSEIARAIRI